LSPRLFRLGARLARILPRPLLFALAHAAGAGWALAAGRARRQVSRNLRRVHGPGYRGWPLWRDVYRTFDSYACYWVESLFLPGIDQRALAAGMSINGWDRVLEAREAGQGVILALPHLGGWEWAGFWMAEDQRVTTSVVVERLEPAELFEWFRDLRQSLGMNVIPTGPGAGTEVVRALKANHAVCLLCDRDLDGGGVEVDFFGERTTLPAGPATLALRTGAPLIPVACYYQGRHHHAEVLEPVPVERQGRLRDDVARVTQDLADRLEGLIRAAPHQWHLLQPNWPSDRRAA
jgi:KDO2-lipid IV(A) lauroyltransferase